MARATAVVTDATDEAAVTALFDAAEAAPGGPLDVAIYNAGNNTPGRIVDMEAEYFERAWRVGCFGGFLFGREAVRRMLPQQARHVAVHRRERVDARPRELRRVQCRERRVAQSRAGDGEGIRTRVTFTSATSSSTVRSAATRSSAAFRNMRTGSAKKD